MDKTFPIYEHVSSSNALLFNERLTSTFVYLAKENNNDIYKLLEQRQTLDQSPLAYEFWKTIKNKHGIHVQKKQISEYGERGCIFKGTFAVKMNPKNVYNIITNMSNEASGYIFSDTFIRSSIIKRFNNDTLVRHLAFKLNRQQNHGYLVFEAHKEIEENDEDTLDQAILNDKSLIQNEVENKQNKYVIVWRSIAGIKNEEVDENILKKENIILNNTDLNNEENLISYETDGKSSILPSNKNNTSLAKTDSFIKTLTESKKEESILTSSFYSTNSLSVIGKSETEPNIDLLQKSSQLTDKIVQSPTPKSRHLSLRKENSKNLLFIYVIYI